MSRKLLPLILAFTFIFSGCTYTGRNVDSLLRPPILSDEQSDIWKVLKKNAPEGNIKLSYPQRGENRSAIFLTNLDDEPGEEAVAFLQPSATSTTSFIEIKVLDNKNGNWELISDSPLEGIQIEDVAVLNVGTGVPVLVVGLNYASDGNHLIKAMQFDGKDLHTIFSKNYQVKGFYDFDSDGNDDIFIVENPESEVKTWARVYKYDNFDFSEFGAVTVNPEITRYSSLIRGYTTQGIEAVYLDGYKGSELMATEILYYSEDEKRLINLTYDGEEPQKYPTDRVPIVTCRDLTNDGIIEVPGVRPLPGYEENTEGALYLTDWFHFSDKKYERIGSSFVNTSFGYAFNFPDKWIGKVTAVKPKEDEVVFYEYDVENKGREELLYLKVSTRSDWLSNKGSSEYELIDTKGQVVYLAKICDTTSSLKLSVSQVKEYFNRIS